MPLEQIVARMADGVLVVGSDGHILFANPAAAEIFGRASLTGREFGFPLAPRGRTEIEIVGEDQVTRCAEMRVVAVGGADQSMLVSLRDITERRRSQREIERLNEALRERVRELESYTHSVSHDLQAPLRSIRAYIAIVMDEGATLPPDVRDFLRRIEVNADRMALLIRDLLRLSRSSLAPLTFERVALLEVVRDVVMKLKEDDTTGATFVIGDLPEVMCDRALIAQVFENLFSNAIKYRRPNTNPRITVEARTDDLTYQIAVRDNGQGFAPEYAERIFRLFERLHSSEAIAGTGIGLSLVQRIVERHGGEVWAKGVEGEGATFYFTLPTEPELASGGSIRD